MKSVELERTFLAKWYPPDLLACPSKEVCDSYIPITSDHATLRIRKHGDRYEITKKSPINNKDTSEQTENTIMLSKEEHLAFFAIPGKKVRKIRYHYRVCDTTAEIDVFQDDLKGLVLIDVEFTSKEAMKQFIPPDFCGVDVTQEEFIAGGMLSGKTYDSIAEKLQSLGYTKIT